ncbi:MAG: hypothetical protein WA609_17430 [Terriglobales bacterium]
MPELQRPELRRELLALGLLAPRQLVSRRRAFLRPGELLAEARPACQLKWNWPVRGELASPSSAWLHLPATVELGVYFPRPSLNISVSG